jgi:hypothetical protein
MRRVAIMAVIAGCGSSWDLRDPLIVGASDTYYVDADGDGWGDPNEPSEQLAAPDPDRALTARNDRDCDDGDAAVTGMTGSICPEDLVLGGATYVANTYGGREYVAVYGGTDAVWPEAAIDACGPWGWGGEIAGFPDPETLQLGLTDVLGAAIDALPEAERGFSGFVDLTHDGTGWTTSGGTPVLLSTPWCAGQEPDPDDILANRLALVRTVGTSEWCWGTPDDAALPAHEGRFSHFVCVRDLPAASDWDQ